MRHCSVCGTDKPIDQFYLNRGKPDCKCKDCAKSQSRAWHDANPGASKKASAGWRMRNPEKMKICILSWEARNQDKKRESARKSQSTRRAKKFSATPAWANEFFISEAYRLCKLREQATGIEWHVDHIVPLKSDLVCGLHVEHNLRVIPASINRSKGNRHWPDMP